MNSMIPFNLRKILSLSILLLGLQLSLKAQPAINQFYTGISLAEKGSWEQALEAFKSALQDGAEAAKVYQQIGSIYLHQQQAEKALEAFRQVGSESSYEQALCYALLNQPEQMLESLRVNLKSSHPTPYYLIQKESAFQAYKSTALWLEFWSVNQYTSTTTNLNEAHYLISQQKYDDAIQVLNPLVEKRAMQAEAYFLRGQSYLWLGEFRFAAEDFKDASSLKPKNDEYLYFMSLARMKQGVLSKAAVAIEEAIRLNAYNPEYLYLKAQIDYKSDKLEQASQSIQTYCTYFNHQEKALVLKARILLAMKQLDSALEIAQQLIQQKQGGDEPWFIRGSIFQDKGLYLQAIEDYGMAIDINPKDPLTWMNRGNCYLLVNESEKACKDFNKALQLGYKDAYLTIREYCSGTTF